MCCSNNYLYIYKNVEIEKNSDIPKKELYKY